MIKSLAVECLMRQPKLNNLAELLRVLVESDSTHEVVAAGRYLVKIFESYLLNKLLTREANQTSAFVYKKMLSFGELAGIHFINRQESKPVFLEWVQKVIRIDHQLGRKEVLNVFLGQLCSCTDEAVWQELKNGEVITLLIVQLRQQSNLHDAKISVLLNISEDATFRQFLQPAVSSKRKRDDDKKTEEQEDDKLRSDFEKEYQRLLVDILKDSSLTDEQLRRVLKQLGESVFRNLQSPLILSEYVLHCFARSSDFEIRVHALAGLYILIGRYGLELENFYDRLLELLTQKINGRSIFEHKQCKRVYKLIENALRSSKVPFGMVCSFVKLLLAEVFRQSSEFTCWAIALIFNIFKKHQNLLNCLDKKATDSPPEVAQIKSDLEILQVHFLPQVRSVLKDINNKLSRTDFLDIDAFSNIRLQKLLQQKQAQFLKAQTRLDVPEVLHPLML